MPEQDLNPASAKFISSLVKSLQIICNGQVDFHESIELVGHINVRVDHKYKFDYIVDEHVSKEGEDSATTFLSNSYPSCPPLRQPRKRASSVELDQDVMFSDLPQSINGKSSQSKAVQDSLSSSHDFCSEDTLVREEESNPNFSVSVGSPNRRGSHTDQIVIKLEGDDDSNDCMVLPASPGDYDPVDEVSAEGFQAVDTSVSFEEPDGNQVSCLRKRRQPIEHGAVDGSSSKISRQVRTFGSATSSQYSKVEDRTTGTDVQVLCQCLTCQSMFANEQEFQEHAHYCEQPVLNYYCSQCYFHIDTRERMDFHIHQCHPATVMTLSCTKCSAHFKTPTGLKMHMEVKHSTNPSLTCPICGKIMYNKTNLDGHVNQHKGIKPHVCTYCSKSFSYKQSASAHEKMCSSRPY